MAREDRSRSYQKYPPAGVDARTPNVARVYDAFLGGKDNFAADRRVLEAAQRVAPNVQEITRANRAFLRRAVRYLVGEAGMTQLLDIGSGLPSPGNVHEIAQAVNPDVRTVYVDNDPVVHSHGQAILSDARITEVVTADLRHPAEILDSPMVRSFIDFSQPVGVLLLAVLHHLSDTDDPARVVAQLRDAVPAGSCLVISSFGLPGEEHADHRAKSLALQALLRDLLGSGYWREPADIAAWFGGWPLVDPGLVPVALWHPDPSDPGLAAEPAEPYQGLFGGVARKPA